MDFICLLLFVYYFDGTALIVIFIFLLNILTARRLQWSVHLKSIRRDRGSNEMNGFSVTGVKNKRNKA